MDFTKRNSSALIYATAARHARIVQMPIEAKTDVYRPRMLADSAEMLAGTVNDVEDPTAIDSTISMLLIQQGFNVQVTGERGSTLLHYMANCGYAALFAVLIELNLEVNRQNDDGRTPLYFATNQKKHHFMKLLLRVGADPKLCDHNGTPPPPPPPMHLAASHTTPDCAKILIAHGANVNVKSATGRTPLL
ncbi:unnamed protein product [Aspergillus oryzae]|nr:unnamed protein product [Aspergillus oryzae]GMF83781.1 unnamed protein product [Aspergillus oryzae]